MSEWQPIETAPLNETQVMLGLWITNPPNHDRGKCYWAWIASGCFEYDGTMWIDFTDERHERACREAPTHWAPMLPGLTLKPE